MASMQLFSWYKLNFPLKVYLGGNVYEHLTEENLDYITGNPKYIDTASQDNSKKLWHKWLHFFIKDRSKL